MKNLSISLLVLSFLSFNAVADNANFGGPEQVNNRMQEDKAERDLPLKKNSPLMELILQSIIPQLHLMSVIHWPVLMIMPVEECYVFMVAGKQRIQAA